MKIKDIKKIIKSEMEVHIPKSAPKIDFPFVLPQKAPIEQKRVSFKLKYVMTTALAALLIVVGFALFNSPIEPTPTNRLLTSDNEIISFSAISSMSLMSTFGINEEISYQPLTSHESQPPIVGFVMPYLKTVEQLLLSDQGLNILSGSSDLPEFDHFIQFETKDLLGNVTVYVMHYNMTLMDANQDEAEYEIEGILIFMEQTYEVFGEKTIESDEEKVKFRAQKDANNYVESFYEIENDKQVFEFIIVQHNQVISESRFEIEYDGEEIKVQLEFQEGDNEGEFEFEFFTENGINLIKIEFETIINGIEISGEMTVQMFEDPISGTFKYRIYIDPDDDDPYEYEEEKEDETEDEEPSLPELTEDEEDDEDDEDDDEMDE
jgi:hypothetical protein